MFTEIVNPYDGFFDDAYFDGIIGLALPGLAQKDSTPLMDSIMEQNLLPSNVFSFYFDRTQNYTKSFISFGSIEPQFYEGDLVYHEVINDKYWQLPLERIKIDGIDTQLCDNNCRAILDTGTSLINGAAQDLFRLIDFLQIDKGCLNYKYLPKITFVMNSVEYDLLPEDYVLARRERVLDPEDRAENVQEREENLYDENVNDGWVNPDYEITECVGAFSAMNLPPPVGPSWILGNIFLSKFFLVFDRDKMRVGLANPKRGPSIEEKVTMAKEKWKKKKDREHNQAQKKFRDSKMKQIKKHFQEALKQKKETVEQNKLKEDIVKKII